ncbi:MAG: hypothetical protein ACYC7F_11250 [Gemmatimonadaceae bacterium]
MTALLTPSATVPAVLVLAVGMLGALDMRTRWHRRIPAKHAGNAESQRRALPQDGESAILPDGDVPMMAAPADAKVGREAAMRLLDAWSSYPLSAWKDVGERAARTSVAEAHAVAAAELILEGVIAHHADPLDVWQIRDAVDTACLLALQHAPVRTPDGVDAARHALSTAALATYARPWLPAQDFQRLHARIAR